LHQHVTHNRHNPRELSGFGVEAVYLTLYNAAFGKKIKAADLTGTDPIVQQIARAEGVARYDHNAPAEVLLRERAKRIAALSGETLAAFETLFKRINGTLAQK